MPTSFVDHVTPILRYLIGENPGSVLDVGAGYGKYGHLIREYCDQWPWSMTIDAVEVFPAYFARIGCRPYDDVFEGDFLDFTPARTDRYDIVLMIDVLEHFTVEDGLVALRKALTIGKQVLVSTPLAPAEQDAVGGNEYERHRSVWTNEALAMVGAWCSWVNPVSLVGILVQRPQPITPSPAKVQS